MKKESGAFKSILSLLTYTEKEEVPKFYIPEINEDETQQSGDSDDEGSEQDNHDSKVNTSKENEDGSYIEDSNHEESDYDLFDKNKEKKTLKTNIKNIRSFKEAKESEKSNWPNYKVVKPIPVKEYKKKDNDAKKASSKKNTCLDNDFDCIKSDIKLNIKKIKKEFNYPANKDIVIREFLIKDKINAFIVYMEGMVDRITINNFILSPILESAGRIEEANGICKLDYIYENIIETHQIKKILKFEEVIDEIMVGDTGIYVDGCDYMIFCETKGYEKRNVSTPQVEAIVRGSQEAFNENLRTNITLIRRIIKDKKLTTEFLSVGRRNLNNVAVIYLEGVINPAIVKEVKRRLNGIITDNVSSAGMIEQFIEDSPFSILPTTLVTERPDRTASHIFEGKIAILSDGSPFAVIVPVTLGSLFHSPEDASLRWQYAILLRFIRFFAIFVAVLLPGLYVALTNFHKEMIPTDLLIAIAKAKENVPFPTIIEVILMEISFELIREAGIRIPGIVGNTIGIIGALILGQAAVQANLVSPVMIIIVAFTGLGNFAIPDFSLAFGVRILRVIFILSGATLGFYGISLSLVALGYIFVSIRTFGVPFFAPIAPRTKKSKDLILRWPLWMQEDRPDYLNTIDKKRQPNISKKWAKEKPVATRPVKSDNKEGKNE